jgi:thiosulfate/3-mercaptopyruvate sulfurtransferase
MTLPVVVDPAWLAARLGEPDLRVVDARWYLPTLQREGRAEFLSAHVPGAVYLDIDEVADGRTALPHMLPEASQFADAVGALGIGTGDRVIVYGARHLIAAARVWWMFRIFGHEAVAVVDGGFPRWQAEGRPVEVGQPAPEPRRFAARYRPELGRDLDGMRAAVATRQEQVLDARSAGRFAGTAPEPRPGLRGGHMPGSHNLPYDRLFAPDGTLLPVETLGAVFRDAGLDLRRPVVTTCGSGVSAAVLALGLHLLGQREVPVYDGSWTEWAGRPDTPVER